MRTFFIAAATLAALSVSQVLAAEDQAKQQPAVTHEMCKSVMGAKMDGKPAHDHARDKTGATYGPPKTQPLTQAEMERMHKECARKFGKADAKK